MSGSGSQPRPRGPRDVVITPAVDQVVSHGRYVTFQLADIAVPPEMFAEIRALIARLRAPPAPA